MSKILITGAQGQLGWELAHILADHELILTDREELDVTDVAAVQDTFEQHLPEVCINCAAYTAVDKAESEQEAAYQLNCTSAENLAKAAKAVNADFFHISTDFVFSGDATEPLHESAVTKPISYYGLSKLQGETAVRQACPGAIIIRTSWLYSSHGHNFVKTMLRLGKERDTLSVVADQVGTPTYARDLALAIKQMLSSLEAGTGDALKGAIYHFSNEGVASWYDFAHAIFEYAGIVLNLQPISTEQYPTPAARPKYSVMDKSKIKQQTGLTIPHWRESLQICLKQLQDQ